MSKPMLKNLLLTLFVCIFNPGLYVQASTMFQSQEIFFGEPDHLIIHRPQHEQAPRNMTIDPEQVKRIRHNIKYFAKTYPKSVNELDVNKFLTKDWLIERYIHDYNRDETRTKIAIFNSLKYFKKFADINDTYFPSELWATGKLQLSGHGYKHEPVLNKHVRCWLPSYVHGHEFAELDEMFTMYHYYKLWSADSAGENIINMYMRMSIPRNLDIGFYKIIARDINTYLRQARFVYQVVGVDSLTESLLQYILSLMLQKRVYFIHQNDMSKHVSVHGIPIRVGGGNRIDRMPVGVKSGKCLRHLKHIPIRVWSHVKRQNRICIREGMKSAHISNMNLYLRTC